MADGFEENAEFFTLTYETPVAVSHNRAFARIAPLLWLRAGSRGPAHRQAARRGWDGGGCLRPAGRVWTRRRLPQGGRARPRACAIAYIVTDDDRRFQALARRLPEGVEPVRLYESYLTNFSFANGE